jgi:hypothetical protein
MRVTVKKHISAQPNPCIIREDNILDEPESECDSENESAASPNAKDIKKDLKNIQSPKNT